MTNEISKDLLQTNIIEVVAALIWDNDKFMICQRSASRACELLLERWAAYQKYASE